MQTQTQILEHKPTRKLFAGLKTGENIHLLLARVNGGEVLDQSALHELFYDGSDGVGVRDSCNVVVPRKPAKDRGCRQEGKEGGK